MCVCVLTIAISFIHTDIIIDVSDDEDTGGEEEDELVDGMAPTPKRRKLAREDALRKAKSTGKYPEFKGVVEIKLTPLTLHSLILSNCCGQIACVSI